MREVEEVEDNMELYTCYVCEDHGCKDDPDCPWRKHEEEAEERE